MELTPETRISAVLASHPYIKDYLISLDPHFKALDNPVMRNTLAKVATLSQVALAGGMDVRELISKLAEEIKRQSGEEVKVKAGRAEPESRQEVLKGIIKDLHAGADVAVLKKRFLELIKDVSPAEIAGMEQKLIEEGMPEEEVKRLCSVHVEVFKESLEKKTIPGLPTGHPVHTYMLENRHAEGLLHDLVELKDYARLPRMLDNLWQIDKHYLRKENQLFPILEAKGVSGPSKVMWAIHDDIRAELKEVTKLAAEGKAGPGSLNAVIAFIEDMIYKEEHILFPMTLETFTEEEWAKAKKGEEEIGFAWVEAEGPMTPSGVTTSQMPAGPIGSLNLDTGLMTPEQVNLMLTHLPVDISFVNEQDEVIYYSNTAERIFPRSPAVIGRRVQNCHPPKSVGTVENILDSFKKGEKDVAEFWINMKGRFIMIRYFAVRDAAGKYRGTLEVSQDLTELRALTGEKRLLDWE